MYRKKCVGVLERWVHESEFKGRRHPVGQVSVVSRGAEGAVAMSADGGLGSSPACVVQLEDTIGAGDNFTAGADPAFDFCCSASVLIISGVLSSV